MAAYTSAQSGDFNDTATWGGGGYPSTAGDTFTIAIGHTVNYNVSSTAEMGASTINGVLQFSTSMNTKLCLGNVSLTINSGGELHIGTSGNPIDKAYTAELLFNTTSDNSFGVACQSGGKYSIYGDSAYCSSWKTALADDAENTDGDVYIKTVDDMSTVWHIGDEITIKVEKQGDSTSHTDAVKLATIVGFSGTTIELDISITATTGVGSAWAAPVVNVTRNVKIGKVGASVAIGNYNTSRPFFVDAGTTNPSDSAMANMMFTGMYRITVSYITMTNVIVRNSYRGFEACTGMAVSGFSYSNSISIYACVDSVCTAELYANYYAIQSGRNNSFSGDIYACYTVLTGYFHTISGNVFGNYYSFYGAVFCKVLGYIYFNAIAVNSCVNSSFFCVFGYDSSENSCANTTDFRIDSQVFAYLFNCKNPSSGFTLSRNVLGNMMRIRSEHNNRVLNSHVTYENFGDIIKTPCDGAGTSPSVDPDGGSLDCIEVSNLQSNLGKCQPLAIFDHHTYRIWATASVSKTYTFKIQSIFTNTLAATEIFLEGEYLNSATDGSLGTSVSTGTIAPRSSTSDWSQVLSVTINPSQTGWVTLQLKLNKYESGKKIYVWPKVTIA